MASNLIAMASILINSDGLQPSANIFDGVFIETSERLVGSEFSSDSHGRRRGEPDSSQRGPVEGQGSQGRGTL